MIKNDRFKKYLFTFKILYLLYLLFAFNSFLNGMAWLNPTSYLITLFGMGLILWMLFRWERYKKAKNLWILILFILSYMVSAGVHVTYGVKENIKGTIWLIIPIALLYITTFDMSKEEIVWEQKRIFVIYISYTVIANLISLSMVYWGRKYEFCDKYGVQHAIGYRWNRLWGVYDDPNHGATITAVAAMFMVFWLIRQCRKTWQKILLIIVWIVNYLYVVLSDSRTGILSLVAGIIAGGIYRILREYKTEGKQKSLLKRFGIVLLSGIILFAGTYAVKAVYQPLDKQIEIRVTHRNDVKPKKNARKVNLEKDYSNGRMDIWKSGMQIAELSPLIGVGYRNMTAYTEEHLPDAYIVNPKNGGSYDSMHNLEMDILVSQGIVGVILFVVLLGNIFIIVIKNMRKTSKNISSEEKTAFEIFSALGAASTFLSFIFYVNAPQNYIFWLMLGYLMRYCEIGEDKEQI